MIQVDASRLDAGAGKELEKLTAPAQPMSRTSAAPAKNGR